MGFRRERGIAACGLACVLCSIEECPGCRCCDARLTCEIFQCAESRGCEGCHQCPEFPCGKERYGGMRSEALLRYARDNGVERLINRLEANWRAGVAYHRPGTSVGEYDDCATQEEVLRLLEYGRDMDPYVKAPLLQSSRFILRMVDMADAAHLLNCYADPLARPFFNADNCTSDFWLSTPVEMEEMIGFWLHSYRIRAFIRLSIVDRKSGEAVGTVEVFGSRGLPGVLRLDLASPYERPDVLKELLTLAGGRLFHLFPVELFVTKAIPEASLRREALRACGFAEWGEREHYFYLPRPYSSDIAPA